MSAKTVVVTGSTRGLGYGLAAAFSKRGCNVVVSARSQGSVDEAVKKLGGANVLGIACDVSEEAQVRALWDASVKRFGRVDYWINNAGLGNVLLPLTQQKIADLITTVRSNLLGTVICTRIVLEGMQQQGGGQIFNMEGFGSDGRMMRVGFAAYGATKCGIRYFSQSIAKELKGGPVLIGTVSPGVVMTETLLGQFDGVPRAAWESTRKIYNRIADEVETVAPYLADQILANTKNGAYIAWLNAAQFIGRIVSPFRAGRDVLSKYPEPKVS
jgi:NAD(P)-dependent dehydrogenase (short-subunit alcohol dehydrogenase family)